MSSSIAIFIFRRDLRLVDNTTLNKIRDTYKGIKILPIFIFNKHQIDKDKNKYYSSNSAQFLFESLEELPELNFYYTDSDITILNTLKSKFSDIKVVGFNKDYTPYAIKRDEEIKKWCLVNHIDVIAEEDYTLHKIGEITKDDGKPYLMYTPFYRKAIIRKPPAIDGNSKFSFIKDSSAKPLSSYATTLKPKNNPNIKVNGGRKNALVIIKKLRDNYFKNYDDEREFPYLDKTTKLSAYIKFGCISIREVYYSLPLKHGIIRELLWHDFYANVTFNFPYIFNSAYNKKYTNIKWDTNEAYFNRWKEGKTGYPFIDWRKGEHYFATKLVDYDPSSNNGGWQWSASTGTDSQPYFRIFSPMAQLQKFDKDCVYIKKWIPELRDVDNKIILNWDKKEVSGINYPRPMVDFSTTSKRFIDEFKKK